MLFESTVDNNSRGAYALSGHCDRQEAYLSIIINVVPLWVISTIFIVFLLLFFHKSLRSTRVYDNCSKKNAHFVYFVEIRTGDSSSSYNRRRTTLTIDMFDDNQTTLARIAIPGYLIFGRKESPTPVIDDDRYFELRITRFWLYRATKFKRVSTIRITHNCPEPDAKIMVYGLELRSGERDKYKTFFPVMSYISSYGSTSRPNACFDYEPANSISALGGSQIGSSPISERLSCMDHILLIHVSLSICFFLSSAYQLTKHEEPIVASIYEGLFDGLLSFGLTSSLALTLRYVVKTKYAINMAMGTWAFAYYLLIAATIIGSTALWIYTSIYSYQHICSDHYGDWLFNLFVAISEVMLLATLVYMIYWLISLICPRHSDPYLMPEDISNTDRSSKNRYSSQTKIHGQQIATKQPYMSGSNQPTNWPNSPVSMTYVMPHSGYPTTAYPQPLVLGTPMVNPAGYKTVQTGYSNPFILDGTQSAGVNPQPITYNAQTSSKGKKLGSNESTGSTYYHQLMKNKGGVKSISQYGELIKQKKGAKATK